MVVYDIESSIIVAKVKNYDTIEVGEITAYSHYDPQYFGLSMDGMDTDGNTLIDTGHAEIIDCYWEKQGN